MRRALVLLASALVCLAAAGGAPAQRPRGEIRFVTRPLLLELTAPAYRLVLSRRTGGLLGLYDRASGKRLWRGSKDGCLWFASAPRATPNYVASCGAGFSYRWNPAAATLTLRWQGPRASATATLEASASWFDLQLDLTNTTGATLERVYFPSDLVFDVRSAQAGYAPNWLPGVRLSSDFFARRSDAVYTYPSRWAFMDYLALDLDGGRVALYTVNAPPAPIQPAFLGFLHTPAPDGCSGPVFCLRHAFETWIADGTSWTSPVVRVRLRGDVQDSVLAYRRDNGIDDYSSLQEKVGDRLPTLVRAPLIKADMWQGLHPFIEWVPDLLRLPSPALLHPVGYQPGGHDASHPDFLPPDPRWGTVDDLNLMLAQAKELGLLAMPYLNVSWWSEEAVTPDLAVQDEEGMPAFEKYNERRGYAVSPHAEKVQERVKQLVDEWKDDVPVDCLFFDQIGARPWRYDFNPAAPTPLAYEDGWLELLEPFSDRCLMVEDGWDRLASVFAGFHGSLLMGDRWDEFPDTAYGPGNWEPYPLATWLLHDKVLMYQHDLYEGTMAIDARVLTWNAAFGVIASFLWDGYDDSLGSPWLELAGTLQRLLGPLYAGKPLSAYTESNGVTESVFGDLRVTANWNRTPVTVGDYGIARNGFLARASGVVAGAFDGTFGGRPLARGTHWLVVERHGAETIVRQPIGGDTSVSVDAPGDARVFAVGDRGQTFGEVTAALREGRLEFRYVRRLGDDPVEYYRVVP
jgi:hypothetical protein